MTRHVTLRLLRLPAGRSFPVSAAGSSQAPMFKPRTETQHIAEPTILGSLQLQSGKTGYPAQKLYSDHCSIIMRGKKCFPNTKVRIMKTWRVHQFSRDVKAGQAS